MCVYEIMKKYMLGLRACIVGTRVSNNCSDRNTNRQTMWSWWFTCNEIENQSAALWLLLFLKPKWFSLKTLADSQYLLIKKWNISVKN